MEKKNLTKYFIALFLIFVMMMGDYYATYVGICNMGVIEEGNPFMVWLFDCVKYPLVKGLIIRALMFLPLLFIVLHMIRRKFYTEVKIVIFVAFVANISVFVLHFRWINLFI